MLWYNDLAAGVRADIDRRDWSAFVDGTREVTARAKTIGTLREKLQRRRETPLSSVQDVAGVRFEAEMTLSQQVAVANEIARMYGQGLECINDLRDAPNSGYRAVHVRLRLEVPVEVQVRTHLQGRWANMYEVVADVLGREIRYEVMPTQPEAAALVRRMQTLSTDLGAQIERMRDEDSEWLRDVQERQGWLNGVVAKILSADDPLPMELATARDRLSQHEQRVTEARERRERLEHDYTRILEGIEADFERVRTVGEDHG